jgi:hypothetical protein
VIRRHATLMLRLEDPTDNGGLGWRQLTEEDLVDLIYIGVKLARRSHRSGLTDRNAAKADVAAKAIARQLAERLRSYPVFGPARPTMGPTCGAKGA